MRYFQIIWDEEDNPDGNVQHIAEHGLTTEDAEQVLQNPTEEGISVSTGRPCCWGHTRGDDFIVVIYELVDAETIYPITAYEVPEP